MAIVSVIIPTYNRADVLPRAIDSALAQTLSSVEVIVVDDASTDETQSVLDSYGDHIDSYTHTENRGGSAARNTGIEAASGEYIGFLDSDDGWSPAKLEKQIGMLDRRDDSWIAAYCDFRQKRSNSFVEMIDNLVRRPVGLEGSDALVDRIFLKTLAHGGSSTIVAKREIVNRIGGFDETFDRNQDLEFLVRLLQHGKMGFVDETLVMKYDTGNPSPEVAQEAMKQFRETFEEMLESRGLLESVRARQRFTTAKFQFEQGHWRSGWRVLSESQIPHYRDGLGLLIAISRGLRKSF